MSIVINKIKQPESALYDSEDNFLGMVNDIEIFDVQTQIVEQRLKGYYLITNGVRSELDIMGNITPYPDEFMLVNKLFSLLVKARVKNMKEDELNQNKT